MSRLKETLELRGSRYGTFLDNAIVTQGLMEIVESRDEWASLSVIHKETIHMTFHKISRMICGDPNYSDNPHDIAGYNTLLEDFLLKKESKHVD